jgi:hypothetical protein
MSVPAPTVTAVVDAARLAVKTTVVAPTGTRKLELWRTASDTGHDAGVRGYYPMLFDPPLSSPLDLLAYDWETPLGIDVVYRARVTIDDTHVSPPGESAAVAITSDQDWLTDLGRPTNSMPILVESLPELRYDTPVGVHRVLDRRDPVLTSAPAWTPAGQLTFTTETEQERDRARVIIGAGLPVLLRSPPERGVGNLFLGVVGFSEQRISRYAPHADRRFLLDIIQVARPDPSLFAPVPPLTYRERLAEWPLYSDVLVLGLSYQELPYAADQTGELVQISPPWLPDDV